MTSGTGDAAWEEQRKASSKRQIFMVMAAIMSRGLIGGRGYVPHVYGCGEGVRSKERPPFLVIELSLCEMALRSLFGRVLVARPGLSLLPTTTTQRAFSETAPPNDSNCPRILITGGLGQLGSGLAKEMR